jgi:protein involved in polysaccharide export with SLBB domain
MLKYRFGQACFVILSLAALAGAAQTPPAKKAPKGGEPVFQDPAALIQSASASKVVNGSGGGQEAQATDRKTTGLPEGPVPGAAVTNATIPAPTSLSGYVPDDKYKLRVGDKISLQILEDRDLPKALVVADSGELDVPYVGRVAASDKTCKQLADELKARLEKEYYHRATVVIALDLANKFLGRAYVWGQVRNQGPIDIAVNENLTAGKAILRAGGFSDFANKKRVKVVRGGDTNGAAKQSFELNMIDILEKGKTEKDMVLQPDDFIIVPSRLINF